MNMDLAVPRNLMRSAVTFKEKVFTFGGAKSFCHEKL